MTLSCRAQAFSVDNLLKTSSSAVTADVTTEAAVEAPVLQSTVAAGALTFQKELGKLPVSTGDFGRNRDAEKEQNIVAEDAVPSDLPALYSTSHRNVKQDFSIYRDERSQDLFRGQSKHQFEEGPIPFYCQFKHPVIGQAADRSTAPDTDFYRLPFVLSSRNAQEEGRSEAELPSTKYRASPSSGISTTCFCHGEIAFCQHPRFLSVTDVRGSSTSITAELCHADLWASFHQLGTEMIITKSGRRMFPALKLRITGLNPVKLYIVRLEFLQPDTRKYRYIYHSSRWMVSGSGDTLTTAQSHRTPEGPISGQVICSQIVSFERLKLTNTEPSKAGQVSLVSMQKFQPQVVIQEVDGSDVSNSENYVIMFPQTSFMAVTAYQNQQITTLKIASNPFAKGFRESGKTRLPYETFMTTLPHLLSYHSALDYLPGFIKPSSAWSPGHCFQRDLALRLDKRCFDRTSNQEPYKSSPVKVMKLDAADPEMMSSTRSPANLTQYTTLQKQLSIPLPHHQNHHHHEFQLYSQQQQQQQHEQNFLISTLPHHLQPVLHPLPYNSELLQPIPKLLAEKSPYENYPQNVSSRSIMIVAQPPPAHKPFPALPVHPLNQLSHVSVTSSKMSKSVQLRDNLISIKTEDSSSSASPRSCSQDIQAVNDSHLLSQSSCSLAEQKYTKTNSGSRSSHSSSTNFHPVLPPHSLAEPAKTERNVTYGCAGCGC